MSLIEVENASKVYRARTGPKMLLARGGFVSLFHSRRERVTALEGISFAVEEGEALGIIGSNGSGKSTLLKLLAGVTTPTTGRVEIRGRVASLLELGAGFHQVLTGRENIYLNGRILGLNRAQVDAVFEDIVEFSGIRDFIDHPVNTYSSGMYVRLGFAVAVHTNPDIFLVDEVLSVGDEDFQRKCRKRIGELREQNKTIVFVSHDLSIVNTLCSRVILLSKGRTVVRDTPRATIDYYLRQIGRASGIHTFSSGDLEAIFCHGRISLFRARKEITAPGGFQMQFTCMGQPHESTQADWETVDRGPDFCHARGRMSRLPVVLDWHMRIVGGKLSVHVALECEHEVALPFSRADLLLPPAYSHWNQSGMSGLFPRLMPGDQIWTTVAPADWQCRETSVLPDDGTDLPPILVTLATQEPYLAMTWLNSDYVTGARVMQLQNQKPEAEATLPKGRHDMMTVEIDAGLTPEQVAEQARLHEAERGLHCGPLTVVFSRGWLRLAYEGETLTAASNLHTQMRIGSLWSNSQDFYWGPLKREGRGFSVAGASPRFPFRQIWEAEPGDGGFLLRVWLETTEPLDVQEYNVTVCLRPEYECWETPHESGAFPPFEPDQVFWVHLNRDYAPGRFVRASCKAFPTASIEATDVCPPLRMTPLNTGFWQNARVLQAISIPDDASPFHFEPGRCLLFAGWIATASKESRE